MEAIRNTYCTALSNNLNLLMKKYGKRRKDVSKDLGVPYTTYTDWVNGNAYPKLENLHMLADYFHIGVDDLQMEISENSDVMRRINAYARLIDESQQVSIPDLKHKTLKERIAEYDGVINFYEYNYGGLIDERMYGE